MSIDESTHIRGRGASFSQNPTLNALIAFIAASGLLSIGGAGFSLSHYTFCSHWESTRYFETLARHHEYRPTMLRRFVS